MTSIKRMWEDLDKWYQHDIDSDQQQIKRFISKHLIKILEELSKPKFKNGFHVETFVVIDQMVEEIKKEAK